MQTGNGTRYGNGQPQWSAHLTSTLRELWATWTAGELSKLLGVPRNAIIGKAWRLKLAPKKASGNGTKKPQRVGPRIRPPVFYVATQPQPILELDFLSLTIDEIRDDECHYPAGEHPPYRFCGQLTQAGSSYCPHHHRVACHPVSPRRDQYNDFQNFRGVR